MKRLGLIVQFQWIKNYSYFYPFTILGTMLVFLSTYLIGTAVAAGNPYSFLLSSLIFAALVILAVAGRLQATKLARAHLEWNTAEPVFARQTVSGHRVSITGFRTVPFFRLHFILRGPLAAGRDAKLTVHREISGIGETIDLPLRFPISGVFHGKGTLAVKDVFGLTRGAARTVFERSIVIRPALIAEGDSPRVEAQRGDENKSRMKTSDIERYFMREYIPGDRHRDINWKASSRFNELFTRISPVTQEKTKIITVHFRPYTSMKSDSLRSVFFLDQCKSALLYFLRSIKQEHSEYAFAVYVGNDLRELESEQDIDLFSTEISSAHFRNPRGEQITNPDDMHPGNVFIFTTAYDTGLPTFLSANLPGAVVHVYRVTIPMRAEDSDHKTRRALWSGSGDPILGSGWILRQDPLAKNPGIEKSTAIILEDDPLEVRIV